MSAGPTSRSATTPRASAGTRSSATRSLPDAIRVEAVDDSEAFEWRPPEARREAAVKDEHSAMALRPPAARLALPPGAAGAAIREAPRSVAASLKGATPRRAAAGRVSKRPSPALERGRVIHRLLQSLPDIAPERRAEIGARYLAAAAPQR